MAGNHNFDPKSIARFWERVEPELNTGCWLWTGATNHAGYGNVYIGARYHGAHRVALMITGREIPNGLHVCHRCDTPLCVNPAHLFVGTNAENREDMRLKGRGRGSYLKGERNGRARLTSDDVMAIRRRAAAGEQFTKIAKDYGVTRTTISYTARGKSWSHLAALPTEAAR